MPLLLNLLHPATIACGVVVLIFCYVLVGAIVNYRKLSQFKGPPLAGFSRSWLFYKSIRSQSNKAKIDAIRKYGAVARIGPNLLTTNDVDILRHISSTRSKWTRSEWYTAMRLDPRCDSVFSTRDEKVHADLRARLISAYNGRTVDTLESDIDCRINDFVDLIKGAYNGIPMDFAVVARFFTLDVLSTIAFGAPFGFMESNTDLWDYTSTTVSFMKIIELVTNHASVRWLYTRPWIRQIAAPKPTDKVGMGPAIAFAQKAVAERFRPDAKVKKDMLGHFIAKDLSQLQCEVEANLQILAGSDSTTTILRCLMYLTVGTPTSYAKLKGEIDAAVASGSVSSPVVKYSEAQRLPYLVATIWETLRLYPPLFGLQSKVAPPGGETIKGIFFPEGTEVAICDDAMCRATDVFGADSNIFRPERWIEADPETSVRYKKTVDTIFGSGRFQCLGRHISFMELHKVIVELMRNFDWAMEDPLRGVDSCAQTTHIQSNMNLIARVRN